MGNTNSQVPIQRNQNNQNNQNNYQRNDSYYLENIYEGVKSIFELETFKSNPNNKRKKKQKPKIQLNKNFIFSEKNLDPYKVLRLRNKFSLDELKTNYKILAKYLHPDKGGDVKMFQTLTYCFKKCYNDYEIRKNDRQYHELKQSSQNYMKQQESDQMKNKYINPKNSNQNFNKHQNFNKNDDNNNFKSEQFNEIFDKYKLSDETDNGYGDWMEKSDRRKDGETIDIKKTIRDYSVDRFNSHFDKNVTAPSHELVEYKEPEPLELAQNIKFSELGENKGDFSNDNMNNNLHFTDYKKAHSTSKLVDTRYVKKRKDYKSINDIESARTSQKFNMSPDEQLYYDKKKYEEEQKEKMRLQKQFEKDQRAYKHYSKIHTKMIRDGNFDMKTKY